MKRRFHDDDDELFKPFLLTREDEFLFELYCVTRPRILQKNYLYKDRLGRIYRPRVGLTEKQNAKPTDRNTSERYIYFDYYCGPGYRTEESAKPERVLERQKKIDEMNKDERRAYDTMIHEDLKKAPHPEIGTTFTFICKHKPVKNTSTVQEFECKVIEVASQGLVISKNQFNEVIYLREKNAGLVLVKVIGSYPRSLIILPEVEIGTTIAL